MSISWDPLYNSKAGYSFPGAGVWISGLYKPFHIFQRFSMPHYTHKLLVVFRYFDVVYMSSTISISFNIASLTLRPKYHCLSANWEIQQNMDDRPVQTITYHIVMWTIIDVIVGIENNWNVYFCIWIILTRPALNITKNKIDI